MNLLRCVGPDLTTPNWLTKCIWPIEGQLMSPEFVYDGALPGGAEMLRGGTTTCHDMYFFPDSAAKALREVGLRVVQGAFVIKYPNAEYKGEEDAFGGARALAATEMIDTVLRMTYQLLHSLRHVSHEGGRTPLVGYDEHFLIAP